MYDRAPYTFVEDNVSRYSCLSSRWDIILPGFGSRWIANKNSRECTGVEFLPGWRVVVHITLRTEDAKVADIRFLTPEGFVGCFTFDGSSRRAVLGVNGVVNSFSPERQGKSRFNENGANAIHDCEVKPFGDTILLRCARRRLLMDDTMVLQVGFPFLVNVFPAIVGTKDNKFLTGLAFDFRVPNFESGEGFAFLSKVIYPRVASGVVSEGDHVEFSTERHDRCGTPEIGVDEFKNICFERRRLRKSRTLHFASNTAVADRGMAFEMFAGEVDTGDHVLLEQSFDSGHV